MEHQGDRSIVGLGLLKGYSRIRKMKLPMEYFKQTATQEDRQKKWCLPVCATISNEFVNKAKAHLNHMQNFRLYQRNQINCS